MHNAMNFRRFIRSPHALLADLATDDIAEQFPTLALEFPELKLLDRSEVSRAGVDRDAGQEPFQLQTLDASGLLHDICAGKIVAAFFENINQAGVARAFGVWSWFDFPYLASAHALCLRTDRKPLI